MIALREKWTPSASFAVKLLACALLLLLAPSVCSARLQDAKISEPPAVKLDKEARSEAFRLLQQLGSDDFGQRQQATRKLWQFGQPVLEILRPAIEGNFSPEAKKRASDLATFIKVGLSPDDDAEIVQCAQGFLERELIVQTRAIQKLCHLERQETARKLINLVPSKVDQEALRDSCSIASSDAALALQTGDDERFMEWLHDPLTAKTHKMVYYYTLWIDGQLDPEMKRLKKEAAVEIEAAEKFDAEQAKKKANKEPKQFDKQTENPKQPSLRTLVGLLRFLGRWDEALDLTNKLHNKRQRKTLYHTILMESGNWKKLVELIPDPELDPAEDDDDDDEESEPFDGLAYAAEGYRLALISFYSGDEELFEIAIGKIESDIEEERQKQKKRGLDASTNNFTYARFLGYALEFERSLKYKPLEKGIQAFQLLNEQRRYAKLFSVFGFETFEGRAKYFKTRSRRVRSLIRQTARYPEQADSYQEKLTAELQHWRQVCGLFATLGLNEEAELYFRKQYFDFREHRKDVGFFIVTELQNMGARESAWEIAQLELERDENFGIENLLNPIGDSHIPAAFLYKQLSKKIKNPYERLRKVAALIRSPMMIDEAPSDLWSEVADVDFSSNVEAARQLFMVWGVAEEKLFSNATGGESQITETLMEDGEFLRAARRYAAQAISNESERDYARAWDAYTKAKETIKARRMRLLFALNFEAYDAYDYSDGYSGTDWQSLPFDCYRLYDALEEDSSSSNCYYMWRMSNGDAKAVLSAHQKMVRMQILRLQYIDSPYFEGSENDHRRLVEGALENQNVELARYWFRKLSTFLPADSGFVEDSFPVFEKIGSDEVVSEIFNKVSQDFYTILESYPNSALHLNNYAWACACSKRNVRNAIELSKQAVKLRDGTAGYRDTLAELYHLDGQHDLAIETIGRAIEINPNHVYYQEQRKKFRRAKEESETSGK